MQPSIQNIQEYHDHFRQTAPYIKNEPKVDRSCNDICCYVVLILLTLLLIAGGIFFIVKADFKNIGTKFSSQPAVKTTNSTTTTGSAINVQAYDISNLKPGIPIIVGMIVLSVVLSLLFLLLLIKFPKCMFYSMLIFGGLLILALAIIMFIAGSYVGGALILVLFLIFAVVMYCNRDKIQIGVVLLETAARFISQKPSVFMAPIGMLFVILGFQIFWLASLVAISLYSGNAKTQQEMDNQEQTNSIFVLIWGFLQVFFSFYFYYCSVFLIATAAAMWYYNVDGNYLCTAIKRIISNHAGSFTFAAMIMAIVTLARQSAQRESQQSSGAAAICYCLVACCLKMIQDLIDVLNHNAVIVMAVTGQSYIDSAKSALSLIFHNFALFYIVDFVGGMVKFAGILFICAIPGIIGFFLLRATAQDPQDNNYITFSVVIIVLISMLIGGIFLSTLGQALSCVFIFYCLDTRFMEMGYPTPQNVPPAMRNLFQHIKGSSHSNQYIPANQPSNPYGNTNSQRGNNYSHY